VHVKLRWRHMDKPEHKLITQNGSTFGDLLNLREYQEGIDALLRAILRRGIKIDGLHINRGGYGKNPRDIRCDLYKDKDRLGRLTIDIDSWGVDVKIESPKKAFKLCWRKFRTLRGADRRPVKTERRPKLKKFGAYVASRLLRGLGEHVTMSIMES
jgi:hypothetical protein